MKHAMIWSVIISVFAICECILIDTFDLIKDYCSMDVNMLGYFVIGVFTIFLASVIVLSKDIIFDEN